MPRLGRVFRPAFEPSFGPAFTRLWVAAAISNLGDGAVLAAGPLLLATLTTDPAAVAAAMFAQQLPWPLFALLGGALADRLSRRTLVVTGDTVRAVLLAGLAVTIAAGTPPLWLLYLVSFLFGTVETIADVAAGALVADTVPAGPTHACNSRSRSTTCSSGRRSGHCCSPSAPRCRSVCTPWHAAWPRSSCCVSRRPSTAPGPRPPFAPTSVTDCAGCGGIPGCGSSPPAS